MSSAPDFTTVLAQETGLSPRSVAAITQLLDDGSSVPFIARYRKEATGGAEDVQIHQVVERLQFHREFHDRRQTILENIREQGQLTPDLRKQIEAATTRAALEDFYLPYRPKRRTRATMAKEMGLEPLAARMWERRDTQGSPEAIAAEYVDAERGVASADDALQGARDIVAERVVETAAWRAAIRDLTWKSGAIHAKAARGKKDTPSKFSDYYDHTEPLARIPGYRVLAIFRGEKEGFLTARLAPDPERAVGTLARLVLDRGRSIWDDQIREAIADGYQRLLQPQIATEIRGELKQRADEEAIEVFASNTRELLMAAPFGARPVIAIDPGFRTGCKVVVLGDTGQLLDHGVVYPTEPRRDVAGTERALDGWMQKHPGLAAVIVGNGTGGRETFAVVRNWAKARGHSLATVMVNESGASIYSASEIARQEFPDHDVTVRGAASIGRRVQDPLAELVKIDPKSIGVGQYQHDVDQKLLKRRLDEVVESCVNRVGVDLNTASAPLLHQVAGLGPKLAAAIVGFRAENGPFASRAQLKKVPGLGEKTYVQAAGFLRVKGKNPLDNSAVHPERYKLVETIANDLGTRVADLVANRDLVSRIQKDRYTGAEVGHYTLDDILTELEKPGRDPRERFEAVEFRDDVHDMKDLKDGMILSGVVTNVTNFGAFVDIGVHQDGLVHVSQIADRFVRDPAEELHVGQQVRVKVMEIDLGRKRIGLSMKAVGG